MPHRAVNYLSPKYLRIKEKDKICQVSRLAFAWFNTIFPPVTGLVSLKFLPPMSPLPVQGQELPWTHRTSRFSLFPRTKVLSPMFLPQFPVCSSCCTFYPSAQAASLPPALQVQWPLLHQPWLARTPAASALKGGCPPPWKQETKQIKRGPKSRR